LHDKNKHVENLEKKTSPSSKEVIDDVVHKSDDPKTISLKPYTPPLPFPQRMAKAKLDSQFGKFLEVLKILYINIPFMEPLTQMPLYAKFLKEILSNKRNLEEHKTGALTEECSAVIQNKLPAKLKDPDSFSIPCLIGSMHIDRALYDLGSSMSLIPLSMCKKLELGEIRPTTISLQLADRSVKYPVGILEDVPIKVGDLYVPVDFVILEMEEDTQTPIILGRPFLATARCRIDVKNGTLSFDVENDHMEFNFLKPAKFPSISYE